MSIPIFDRTNDLDWNFSEKVPPFARGEYWAVLSEPESALPGNRRYWNGRQWSKPYFANQPEAVKEKIRSQPSEFHCYWRSL